MVVCCVCKEEFKDNFGGQLTNHVRGIHNLSKEDYFIISELNNIEPICACGYCTDRPSFYRDKFKEFAIGHENHEWKKQQYIIKFGTPFCKGCGGEVKFYRGYPREYCSFKCLPPRWNQEKIKTTVKEKYGVDNVMCIKEFRDKIKLANATSWENDYDNKLSKVKKTNLDRFGVEFPFQREDVKDKQRKTMMKNHGFPHYSKTDKFREETSKRMMLNNPFKFIDRWKSNLPKKYKSTELSYQSSYEYDFLEFCENNNVLHLIRKSPTFRYLNRESYHFPDYLYDNKVVIEIKSKWIMNLQGGDEIIQEKIISVVDKYQYLLILDKDYYQFEKLIKNINL